MSSRQTVTTADEDPLPDLTFISGPSDRGIYYANYYVGDDCRGYKMKVQGKIGKKSGKRKLHQKVAFNRIFLGYKMSKNVRHIFESC